MVRFSGAGAGVAELSWGQAGLWDAMQRQRTWLPIGGVCPLPPGLTRADLTRQLRSLMSRYPTLRTRLRLDPDEPRQVVSATGEIALEIVDAPDDADPRQVADAVMCRFERTPYDVVDQWPVRVAVVRHRGAFTHQVVVMCHLVTDAAGALLLLADLKRLAAGPGTGEAEEDGIAHPLAQARWQRSPKGQRMNDAALRYCRRVLAEVPARRFPEPGYRPKPRYWRGRFVSAALYQAVRGIAARTRLDTPTVLLAMFAIAQVRVTGLHPAMAMVLVNNRFRRELAGTVSPVTNAVPYAIDVAGATVDEVLARARSRALAAYKHGYFDPLRFNDLVAEVSRQRGEPIDTACYINDRRSRYRDMSGGPLLAPDRLAALRRETSFEWVLREDEEAYERFFLHFDDVPDVISAELLIDSHQVAPADAEGVLRGMEEVAVSALADPHAPAWEPAATPPVRAV